jgi:hypothetical protein
MGSRDLIYILLLVIVVFLARKLYYSIDPLLRNRFGSRWGEPPITPSREMIGLVLLAIGIVLAFLFLKACPFRIE